MNVDGTIGYAPDADFFGSDSFDYQVCDLTGPPSGPLCSTATVDITVNSVNDPPVADDDTAVGRRGRHRSPSTSSATTATSMTGSTRRPSPSPAGQATAR